MNTIRRYFVATAVLFSFAKDFLRRPSESMGAIFFLAVAVDLEKILLLIIPIHRAVVVVV